ncbi:hypothetical protein [Streptomyces sp. NPDC051994]|uniref:hypothetical protein n=1 Tax=unclassified Streptomyces TaxID=2593676 RepID=UPI00342AD130
MHDAPADDYQWPTCAACGKDLWVDEAEAGRQACRPCEARTAQRLAELPVLFAQLNTTAALMRGSRGTGAGTSGTRVPPIPPRLEVLTLAGPGGVAAELRAMEDAWRVAFGRTIAPRSGGARMFAAWRIYPTAAVPEHVNFLRINLERACERYESVGQDIDQIRRLHAECTGAASPDRRPGRVKIGACPVALDTGPCATPLTATVASSFVQCPNCRTAWDGYAAWRELRLAQQAVLGRGGNALESAA